MSTLSTPHKHLFSEIAARRLHDSIYLDLRHVSCAYHDGVLVLQGRLPTYHLKQMAQEAVNHLDGVERIENRIEVGASGRQVRSGVTE
jgi:osmotically-inducible protein OsmY